MKTDLIGLVSFMVIMMVLTGCEPDKPKEPSKRAQEFIAMLENEHLEWKYVTKTFSEDYLECEGVKVQTTGSNIIYVDNVKVEFLTLTDHQFIRKAALERKERQVMLKVNSIQVKSLDERLRKLREEEAVLKAKEKL